MSILRLHLKRLKPLAFILISAAIAPFFLASLALNAAAEDAFQWEDASGHTFFGANPPDNAKNVKKLNSKRFSKYSAQKLLAPYKQYVRPSKVTGDLPADGHDPALEEEAPESVPDKSDKNPENAKVIKDKPLSKRGPAKVTERAIDQPDLPSGDKATADLTKTLQTTIDSLGKSGAGIPDVDKIAAELEKQLPDDSAAESEFPVLLEQGDLSVKHNKKREVTDCRVVVYNRGKEQAKGVVISFQFPDGTVIPANGPSSISGSGQAEYSLPKANLPVAIPGGPAEGGGDGPIPMVLIQSAA